MDSVITLLEILIPSLVIGIICYLIINKYVNYEKDKKELEIERARQEILLPARMQAYERVTIFLERSTPENLIRRVIKVSMSARLFQSELIASIRHEYDHNLSQQIYMSPGAWNMVKTATEETVRLINIAATNLGPTAMATDLAENILKISTQLNKLPVHIAIESVKKEFHQYYLSNTVIKAN